MDIGSLLVADAQSAKLIQPSESSFHHPSPSAQSASMFGVALGEPRLNVAVSETSADCLCVIPTVAQYAIRTMAGSSALSLQRWNSVN
jgi:hypothetical protein